MEDAVLRTIARLDGTPFPSTTRLASRWLRGRVARRRGAGARDTDAGDGLLREVVAVTYQAMGLLPGGRRRTGTTPAGSGAATTSACPAASGSAARSPSAPRPARAALAHTPAAG